MQVFLTATKKNTCTIKKMQEHGEFLLVGGFRHPLGTLRSNKQQQNNP